MDDVFDEKRQVFLKCGLILNRIIRTARKKSLQQKFLSDLSLRKLRFIIIFPPEN